MKIAFIKHDILILKAKNFLQQLSKGYFSHPSGSYMHFLPTVDGGISKAESYFEQLPEPLFVTPS